MSYLSLCIICKKHKDTEGLVGCYCAKSSFSIVFDYLKSKIKSLFSKSRKYKTKYLTVIEKDITIKKV